MDRVAPGGSAANAIFVTRDKAWAWQWHPDDTPYPNYFTLHRLHNNSTTIISSEPITALGTASDWHRMNNHELHEFPLGE